MEGDKPLFKSLGETCTALPGLACIPRLKRVQTWNHDLKGIVQRILRGVNTKLKIICAGKLEARLFFFFNFKETPSQEEHKTVVSGLKI